MIFIVDVVQGGARAMSEEELVTEPSQSPRNDKQATDRGQPDYFTVMKGQLADPSYKTCTDPICKLYRIV